MKINPQLILIRVVIPLYRTIHVNDFIVITGYYCGFYQTKKTMQFMYVFDILSQEDESLKSS